VAGLHESKQVPERIAELRECNHGGDLGTGISVLPPRSSTYVREPNDVGTRLHRLHPCSQHRSRSGRGIGAELMGCSSGSRRSWGWAGLARLPSICSCGCPKDGSPAATRPTTRRALRVTRERTLLLDNNPSAADVGRRANEDVGGHRSHVSSPHGGWSPEPVGVERTRRATSSGSSIWM
jgi:hypothetical protein